MTKSLRLAIMTMTLAAAFPLMANAAWWNPLSWPGINGLFGRGQSEQGTQDERGKAPLPGISVSLATSTAAEAADDPSSSATSSLPTTADLYRRIAELEDKLQKAQAALAQVTSAAAHVAAQAAASSARPSASGGSSDAVSKAPALPSVSDSQVQSAYAPAIVRVDSATSSGSGVIIDAQGDILVAAHVVWSKNSAGAVIGAADAVSVTLSNGSKQTASVIGIDEAVDLAVVQLSTKKASTYLASARDPIVDPNDMVYVMSFPVSQKDSTAGYGFAPATAPSQSAGKVDAVTSYRPIDNGGAMVTAHGTLIGIPHIASCKVLEDMTNCLKYSVTAQSPHAVLAKLVAGMELYKNKANRTPEEALMNGELQNMYQTIQDSSAVDYAVRNVTGQNSFDFINQRLADDQDGKMTKIYLTKLKLAADSMEQAMDVLKQQEHGLNVFFADEEAAIARLSGYQRSVAAAFSSHAIAKEKEYAAQVDLWTKKRNEYDGYLTDPTGATHDYLMTEGVAIEHAASYLTAEKQALLGEFSGENVAIF